MNREILINADNGEIRVAVQEDGQLVEIHVERPETQRAAGNIYRAKVENVLPGMQAAFVNIGLDKNAFLYVADAVPAVNFDEIEGDGAPKVRRGLAINKMLRPGQKVVVQVIKDPIGSKGARVSAYVTLPGHYVVLMPNVDYVGVSRRIADPKERQRLRQAVSVIKPRGMGVIVRTAADGHDVELIKSELTYLHNMWKKVTGSRAGSAPKLLHRDLGLVGRVVRDLLSETVTRVVVDAPDTHAQIGELIREAAPELEGRLELYPTGKQDMFAASGIEAELNRAVQRRVWLKSGGYLVIDETEAFTVFDVNTGRYVGTTSLAMTVLDTNLEAAAEIARQLRLRDIGGIIIIDFIDMDASEHRKSVINRLEQHLARDRTRSHVLGLTELGLVEMTRKKVRQPLGDLLTKTCPCCEGRGKILSEATMSSRVRREARELLRTSDSQALLIEVHPAVAAVLIGAGGQRLREMERETGKVIYVRGSEDQTHEGFKFRQFENKDDVQAAALPVRAGDILDLRVEEPHAANSKDGIARVEGFVLDIEGGAEFVGERIKVKVAKVHRTYAEAQMLGEADPVAFPFEVRSLEDHAYAAQGAAGAAVASTVAVATSNAAVIATPRGAIVATPGAAAVVTPDAAVFAASLASEVSTGAKPQKAQSQRGRSRGQGKQAKKAVEGAEAKAAGGAKEAKQVNEPKEPKQPVEGKQPKKSTGRKRGKGAAGADKNAPAPAAGEGITEPPAPVDKPDTAEGARGQAAGADQEPKAAAKSSKPRRRGGRSRRGKEGPDGPAAGIPPVPAAAEIAATKVANGSTLTMATVRDGGEPQAPEVAGHGTAGATGPTDAAETAGQLAKKVRRRRGGRSRRGGKSRTVLVAGQVADEPGGATPVPQSDPGSGAAAADQPKPRRSRSSRRRQAARAAKARREATGLAGASDQERGGPQSAQNPANNAASGATGDSDGGNTNGAALSHALTVPKNTW